MSNLKKQKVISTGKRGFTLIEILLVIVIIGILAGTVLVMLNNKNNDARDKRRMQELGQIAKALEIYYSENGYYPTEVMSNTGQRGRIGDFCYNNNVAVYDVGNHGDGKGINEILKSITNTLPPGDPKDNCSNEFFYYYDGYHQCNVGDYPDNMRAVIYANKMENLRNANGNSIGCANWGDEGRNGSAADAYHIILGKGKGS